MKSLTYLVLFSLVFSLYFSSQSFAISEDNYDTNFQSIILPFLKSGEQFKFKSADRNYELSAVRFVNTSAKGTIVVINGRSESWLKYGEVFYDLYQKGFSIYSYDHRGQGLSPHLSNRNSEIGNVDSFGKYSHDLNEFVSTVVKPQTKDAPLFLIAHSMGGAVATEYLESHPGVFKAVALSAPMLRINTKPYPEPIARAIVWSAQRLGLGQRYAIGMHDDDCGLPFDSNIVTSSPARWAMDRLICKSYPDAVIGGPSNRWVHEALRATKYIRRYAYQITTPILLFQAENDQLVINSAQTTACAQMSNCTLNILEGSQHETLMEKDSIRNFVFEKIESFFSTSR